MTLATRNMARVVQTDIKHLNVYGVLNADKVVVEESQRCSTSTTFASAEGAGVSTRARSRLFRYCARTDTQIRVY